MLRRAAPPLMLCVVFLVACGDGGGASEDAGPGVEPLVDAGAGEGVPDAGDAADAGALDAGRADAGVPDAGAEDSGVPDAGPKVALSLELRRLLTGSPSHILATVRALDAQGQSVAGLDVRIDVGGATLVATGDGGVYETAIVPPIASGELTLFAHLAGSAEGATRTALVLPTVGGVWGQAQPLGGLVNTEGTEDSSTISPDGQWLIVGTYTPVDLICCVIGCGGFDPYDGDSPACDTALGPVNEPFRPEMPGASRVRSPTEISDGVPVMCATGPDGGSIPVPARDGGVMPFALPPVAPYMFQRQTDGGFANPKLLDTGSDGFIVQPFCFTFLASGGPGANAPVIFGYHEQTQNGTKPHPWITQLVLGAKNTLSSYSCPAGATTPVFAPNAIFPLPVPSRVAQAGNTSVAVAGSATYLLSDDESANPPFIEFAVQQADGGYSAWAPIAVPGGVVDRRQPVSFAGRLAYFEGSAIVSVAWSGGDPGLASSFSDHRIELGIGASQTGSVGEVVAVGQPTFAAYADGGVEMVFVYYRRTTSGLDGQIASVPLR